MRILGLIPARGGSKGIPHKNRKELGGKPLLQYTIEAAKKAKSLDRVIFSSEDATLRTLAHSLGVDVPFERPAHLAEDHSGSLAVVQHALETMAEQGDRFDAVCLLQVTTPFRTASDIDAAIEKFKKDKVDTLLSVQKVPHQYNPHWVFTPSEAGQLTISTGDTTIIKRRQELPDAYIRDGAIYITKTEVILKQDSLYGSRIGWIELDPERHVNIDTPEDWERAEQLYKKLYF
ncbi:acylneuraminate cytidylyltransferase family protein [Altibacter sp.]|uniref:acylneuraminate cytidylyltransferase family protein n=1 Tax=Altibacter sp. TaxID=2024823 RepID=UPI000C8A1218|nr:acylneuraminate cytidylyltransferase family protein [Altibacter sp.]MAP54805.1 acylneuraminate cytidylyltransferase [Altibacter sp.]